MNLQIVRPIGVVCTHLYRVRYGKGVFIILKCKIDEEI